MLKKNLPASISCDGRIFLDILRIIFLNQLFPHLFKYFLIMLSLSHSIYFIINLDILTNQVNEWSVEIKDIDSTQIKRIN